MRACTCVFEDLNALTRQEQRQKEIQSSWLLPAVVVNHDDNDDDDDAYIMTTTNIFLRLLAINTCFAFLVFSSI